MEKIVVAHTSTPAGVHNAENVDPVQEKNMAFWNKMRALATLRCEIFCNCIVLTIATKNFSALYPQIPNPKPLNKQKTEK